MTTLYAVWAKDQAGSRVALIESFPFLQYTRRLGDRDTYELHLSVEREVDRAKAALFELDGQIEVYRRPAGSSWALDLECFHRRARTWAEANGQLMWSSVGRGYEDLLKRRIVVPDSGESHQTETGTADDVMKAYVTAQAGSGAAAARQLSGLSVDSDLGEGPSLDWSSRYGFLLDVCQDITEAARGLGTPVWFAVAGSGAATFDFQAGASPYGTDRRDTLVFTHLQGNMVAPEHVEDRTEERNYLYVGGQGEGASRIIEEVEDATAGAYSPWNRCEAFVDARDLSLPASLQDRGEQRLSEHAALREFTFEVAQTPNCQYGVHWTLGDWATARFLDEDIDIEISAVTVTLSGGGGEKITAEFRVL